MVQTHPWSPVVIKLYSHTCAPWWVMQTWWEAMRRHHDPTQPLSFTPLTVDLVRDCLPVDHPAAAAELGGTSLLKMFTAWNANGRRWLQEINQPKATQRRDANYWIRTYWDDDFPFRLRAMVDPPVAIWSTRPFPWLSGVPSVAVVGSRRISTYGQWATMTYVRDLVEKYGYAIVSGCAPGVDWYAHKTAMRYGGMTVGLVAGGLAGIKPTVQTTFADYECAAVVSEYPPATSIQSWQYAVRNRLISGLADAILVVEAGARSGTLITARAALDQGKDVMVVPQSVWGKNVATVIDLANAGAFLVSSADDLHGWMQV
jgi:DNA processing protein